MTSRSSQETKHDWQAQQNHLSWTVGAKYSLLPLGPAESSPWAMLTVVQNEKTIQMGTFFSQWRKKQANYRQVTLKHEPVAPFAKFLWPKPPRSQQPFADWTGDCEEAECISGCSPCSPFPIHFCQRCLWAKKQYQHITIMLDKKSHTTAQCHVLKN